MSTSLSALGSMLTLGIALALSTACAQSKPAAQAEPSAPTKSATPAPAPPAAPTEAATPTPAASAPPPAAAPAASTPAPAASTPPPAAAPGPPKPAPELDEFMKDTLGTWSCTATFAAGGFGPGSPEIKASSTVKFSTAEAILGGFFYKGEYTMAKSKTVPMALTAIFYLGYEPGTKQITNVSVDSVGAVQMGLGPLTATSASWSGTAYIMGSKLKFRETLTKVGPKELTHKVEADMGKGFQQLGEDVCKK